MDKRSMAAHCSRRDKPASPRLAIVGGGPSGLITAHLLERQAGINWRITLLEASARLGGKMHTRRFDAAPVRYESGVAECYDFHQIGPDPLRELVDELRIGIVPTQTGAMVLRGSILRDDRDILQHFGSKTHDAIVSFRAQAAAMLPLPAWHRGFGIGDNLHPWAGRTAQAILEDLPDPVAREYFQVASRSDMATEPHRVSGLIGLRNMLKSLPVYGAQYTLDGGMEMLPRRLAEHLTRTRVQLDTRVLRVAREPDGRYSVCARREGRVVTDTFDAVVLALPYNQLQFVEMAGGQLRRAMTAHVAHYDSPGHYLRVSMLFRTPFWRHLLKGSWFLLDAFGGCCVYDESAHGNAGGYGVLGWLLAGADAVWLCNADERDVVERVLGALPADLQTPARRQLLEVQVHRWAGAVSGQPGGFTLLDPSIAHRPEPAEHPHLVVVGDYLFDSTLNGVFRSARVATGLLAEAFAARSSRAESISFTISSVTRGSSPSVCPLSSRTTSATT